MAGLASTSLSECLYAVDACASTIFCRLRISTLHDKPPNSAQAPAELLSRAVCRRNAITAPATALAPERSMATGASPACNASERHRLPHSLHQDEVTLRFYSYTYLLRMACCSSRRTASAFRCARPILSLLETLEIDRGARRSSRHTASASECPRPMTGSTRLPIT